MGRNSTAQRLEEAAQFGSETIEREIRARMQRLIEAVVEEELSAALGAAESTRVAARRGYRHGTRARTLTTSTGPARFALPRARLHAADGTTTEWQSRVVPLYQRRTRRVDEALLGVYLAGANSRRIRTALQPLLAGGPLSKDAVSRVVGRLKETFTTWRARDLTADRVCYLFFDGWYPLVRIGKRRARVPVLVTRGVTAPQLAVIDGHPGLPEALRAAWPRIAIQRCTVHKLRNLQAKAPCHLHEELTEDYRRMIYGLTRDAVLTARRTFRAKWRRECPGVVTSLDEAGDALFTFLAFPRAQWKALRTTNALERINGEFRRRTKTQAMLPSEEAVVLRWSACSTAGRFGCAAWTAGATSPRRHRPPSGSQRERVRHWRWCLNLFPPLARHHRTGHRVLNSIN